MALALQICACGSSGPPSGSAQQFAARANFICLQLAARQAPRSARLLAAARSPRGGGPEQAVRWRETVGVSLSADEDLSALAAPSASVIAIRALASGYLLESALEREIEAAEEHENASAAEHVEAALSRLVRRNAAAARALGLGDCSEIGPRPKA